MCESVVVLRKGGRETKIMEDVGRIVIEGDTVTCIGILGQRKQLKNAMVRDANLMEHRIILEEAKK